MQLHHRCIRILIHSRGWNSLFTITFLMKMTFLLWNFCLLMHPFIDFSCCHFFLVDDKCFWPPMTSSFTNVQYNLCKNSVKHHFVDALCKMKTWEFLAFKCLFFSFWLHQHYYIKNMYNLNSVKCLYYNDHGVFTLFIATPFCCIIKSTKMKAGCW